MHFIREGFSFPAPLANALVKQFFGGQAPSAAMLKKSAAALKRLWPVLAKDRGQKGESKHYSLDRGFAETYASYYLPVNLMKPAMILEEMKLSGLGLHGAIRWIDVGTGPGTAFWGAAWWAAHRDVELEFWGLEQSKEFISLASGLSRTLTAELAPARLRSHWELFTQGKSKALTDWIRQVNPQVLSMMNSVGEMEADLSKRAEWISAVVDELSTCGQKSGEPRWLILIEPGSKAASRELSELRQTLRDRAGSRKDVKIWLPCLSERPCGVLDKPDDWCHEEAQVQFPEWLNELGAEAGLRKEAVIFSYMVVSVGVHPPEPAEWPGRGMRVVSQMMREKGLTQCFLCTAEGKKKARVLNSRVTAENEAFVERGRGQIYKSVELSEKGDVVKFEDCAMAREPDPTVFPPLR